MSILVIILIVVAILIIAAVAYYNKFVKMRNGVDNAWSQIDVQLQRRLDLIPNLIETVKGYATHEAATLESVTNARTACMNAANPQDKMAAEGILGNALKNLFAVSEGYPDLKANQNFLNLQNQLAETEDKISYMRQSFNDTVMKYNTAIQTFPGVLIAGPLGFHKRESFDADSNAEGAVRASFPAAAAADIRAVADARAAVAESEVATTKAQIAQEQAISAADGAAEGAADGD